MLAIFVAFSSQHSWTLYDLSNKGNLDIQIGVIYLYYYSFVSFQTVQSFLENKQKLATLWFKILKQIWKIQVCVFQLILSNRESIRFLIPGLLVWSFGEALFLHDSRCRILYLMVICLLLLIHFKISWDLNKPITCGEIDNYWLVIQESQLGGPSSAEIWLRKVLK